MSSNKNTTRKNRKTEELEEAELEEEVQVQEVQVQEVQVQEVQVPEVEVQDHEVQVEEEVQDITEIELQENDILMVPTKEKEIYLNQFAKIIENNIENLESEYTYMRINTYAYIEIDGIPVDIYIGKDKYKGTYKFQIVVEKSFIESEDTSRKDTDISLLSGNNYKDVFAVLKYIEEVKNSYKLIEHDLKSPNRMEYIKLQRKIYPIPPDKKCSVCYEPTIEYTVCKHPICFRCRYKCIVSNNLICPICRNGKLKLLPMELGLECE